MYMNFYTYYITDWVTTLKINLNFPFSFSQKVSFIEDLIELLFHSYIVDIYKYAYFTSHKSNLFLSKSGTCINNTSVMMFKKGSFEIGATVYPVAIKVRLKCCIHQGITWKCIYLCNSQLKKRILCWFIKFDIGWR